MSLSFNKKEANESKDNIINMCQEFEFGERDLLDCSKRISWMKWGLNWSLEDILGEHILATILYLCIWGSGTELLAVFQICVLSYWTCYCPTFDAVLWLSSNLSPFQAWPRRTSHVWFSMFSFLLKWPWKPHVKDGGAIERRILKITWRRLTCQVGVPVLDFKWASNKLLSY